MERTVTYDILERIGAGGMATVHRARQRGLCGFDRIVALKRMRPEFVGASAYVDKFIHEARIGAQLQHPNVVRLYDFGRSRSGPYIALEYLEGWQLDRLGCAAANANIRVPLDVILPLLLELCDALDHVHGRAIVHRDASASSVNVTRDGHAVLIDFGIAVASPLPACRHLAGKPAYMAPETIRGKPFDARVDLFAAGVIAWELLAGRSLFRGRDDFATIDRVLHKQPPPPSRYRDDCPPALDTIVLAALAKDPQQRIASAALMRTHLEHVVDALAIDARPRQVADWFADRIVPITQDDRDGDTTMLDVLRASAA